MAPPPRLAKWLLRIVSSRERDEGFLGDVEELYQDRCEGSSPSGHGRLWYWGEVLRALPGFIGTSLLGRAAMAGSYLRIVCRNLVRQRSYSLINLFGLTLGITCCILILAYVGYELSYDGYHAQADRIFRVAARLTDMGQTRESIFSPAPVGSTLVQDYPEVLASVRFMPTVKRVFKFEDRVFFQERVFYADRSIFDVFSFELTKGDPDTALEAPFTMVLTETAALKYFGDQDPVGRSVNWDNKFDYTVTGVVKDPPANSHFTFEVLASFATLIKYDARIGSWRSGSFATYVLLREGTDPEDLERKMEDFDRKYLEPLLADSGSELESFLQPLKRIHLHSRLDFELGANSDIRVVQVMVGIAVIILLLACINFMNLSTARSARRAREVGVRKVLGAVRIRLVGQFLAESFVYAVLSMAIALLLTRLVLPYFRVLAAREIPLDFLKIPYLVVGLAGVIVFVGFTAGSYPAFFLSAFKPVSILRGSRVRESRGSRFRSVLVVFQFSVSIVLIIGTIVIFHQQRFMESKDLGFQKQNLLVIALQNAEARLGLESLKHEMLSIPGVKSAGASSMVPGEMYLFNVGTYPEGFPEDQSVFMDNFLADHGFLDTFEIEVVAGRGFTQAIRTDVTDAVMLNETAVRALGWSDPVGKSIVVLTPFRSERVQKTVIGVFKDIHQRSLYSAVAPTIITHVSDEGNIENRARRLTLRLETGDLAGTLALIEAKWEEAKPGNPYFSFLLDEFYDSQHRSEKRLGSIFRSFALMAVLIGCVGLFGLAAYLAEQRTKEIGIRKVVGARAGSIVLLLCKEFILLVTVANVVAWPVAYFALRKWLQNFPYAVSLELGVFVMTSALTLIIALLTVGFQSFKAASADPVAALRHE